MPTLPTKYQRNQRNAANYELVLYMNLFVAA